jgi:hypothetical protein
VDQTIAKLEPFVANLSALALLDKTYVYGFDEMRIEFNRSVYEVFCCTLLQLPVCNCLICVEPSNV